MSRATKLRVMTMIILSTLLAPGQAQAKAHRLTLKQCIRLALEASPGLQVSRLRRQQARLTIGAARGAFFPVISSSLSFRRGVGATPYAYSDSDGLYDQTTFGYGAGVSGLLPIGATYDLALSSEVLWTDMSGTLLSPQHINALTLTVTQPLLRGWGLTTNLGPLRAARVDLRVSQQRHRARVDALLLRVATRYWTLVDRRANLATLEGSLGLARDLQGRIRARVDAGTMSPLELVEAKAAVAMRREAVLVAQQRVQATETALLGLIYSDRKRGAGAVGLDASIVPTQPAPAATVDRPLRTLVEQAQRKRPRLRAAALVVKSGAISLAAVENSAWPRLDLMVKGGLESLSGKVTCDVSSSSCLAPVEAMRGGHGTAWGQVFSAKVPFMQLGLSMELPVSGDVRRQQAQRARLKQERLKVALRRHRRAVAMEVRAAHQRLQSATRRIQAVEERLKLTGANLAAADKKFKSGLCNSYYVLRVQLELGMARSALARARKDQALARVTLEAAVGTLPAYLGVKVQ